MLGTTKSVIKGVTRDKSIKTVILECDIQEWAHHISSKEICFKNS